MDQNFKISFTEYSVHDIISNPPSEGEAMNIEIQLEPALLREEVDAGVNRVPAKNGKLKGEVDNLKKTLKLMVWGGFLGLVAVEVAIGVADGILLEG